MLNGETVKVLTCCDDREPVGRIKVQVPRKPGEAAREAAVELKIAELAIQAPPHRQDLRGQSARTWIVVAQEVNSAENEPVSWTLLSTRPVLGFAEAAETVRLYTLRWKIEQFHFTLKSGCQVERLQFDNVATLSNALAAYFIVAWRLMYLTFLAREDPLLPANAVLEEDELEVLTEATKKPIQTVQDAVLAIAKLGGYVHYKTAPPPGVKTLWVGLTRLDGMVAGWDLYKFSGKSESR